jgi:hypothetical protein
MKPRNIPPQSGNFIDEHAIEQLEIKIYSCFVDEFNDHPVDVLDSSVIRDFAAMGACLTPEIVTKQLKKFSLLLEHHLKEKKLLLQSESGVKILKKPNRSYVSNYKTLLTVLESWAHENGFNQGGSVYCLVNENGNKVRKLIQLPPSLPTVFAYLDTSTFRGALQRLGYLFKDKGISIAHGEFTHIWAIFVIVEQNKDYPFLKHSPLDLYKKLGSYPYIPVYEGNPPIWDIIFDQVGEENFTVPEFLNEVLRGNPLYDKYMPSNMKSMIENNMYVLSKIIEGRYKKRLLQCNNNFDAVPPNDFINNSKLSGIIVNNAIWFKTAAGNRVDVEFDDIESENSYDPNLETLYKAPLIPKDVPFIEQLYAIFNSSNWNEKQRGSHDISKHISGLIFDSYNKYQSLRKISLLLTKYFLRETDQNFYISHLINYAQGLLKYHDANKDQLENEESNRKRRRRF